MKTRPSPTSLRVLVLEDDALLRDRILMPGLARYGFDVAAVGSGKALEQWLEKSVAPDIVLIDVGLPDTNGFAVASQLRIQGLVCGIVMLTSLSDTRDQVRGLSGGADAYLTKPVEIDLLAATLHSLGRRLTMKSDAGPAQWRLSADGWCLISPQGMVASLTETERRICERLLANSGLLVSRETLVEVIAEDIEDFDGHRLDSMIYRIRSKTERLCGQALPLSSVHGRGYIFNRAG